MSQYEPIIGLRAETGRCRVRCGTVPGFITSTIADGDTRSGGALSLSYWKTRRYIFKKYVTEKEQMVVFDILGQGGSGK